MNIYEIRLTNGYGDEYCRGTAPGNNAMQAAETAIENNAVHIIPDNPVYVIAINTNTGLSFKFEMAQAVY